MQALSACWLEAVKMQCKSNACWDHDSLTVAAAPTHRVCDQQPDQHTLICAPSGQGLNDSSLKGCQEGNGLNSLAQAHFVSQDDMLVLLPGKEEPVEALQLVGVQLIPLQEGGIFTEFAHAQLAPCCRACATAMTADGLQDTMISLFPRVVVGVVLGRAGQGGGCDR